MARFVVALPLESFLNRVRIIRLVALILSCSCFDVGQSITGLPPFAPLAGGGGEVVNLANLNVHLSIPVVHKPGRGLDFDYVLNYDSTVWTHLGTYGSWSPAPNWGWSGVGEGSVGFIEYEHYSNICTNATAYHIS